jgi:SanA protein
MKKIIIALITLMVLFAVAVWYCNNLVVQSAEGKTFNELSQLPSSRVGLLLGTSKYVKSGRQNIYFNNRITAALELFKAHKIEFLVISGDNSRVGYDEPTDMKTELVNNGVDSNKIFLDYAGFRTFDSMVRLKEVFGQDSAIVVSQKFHNERAIYIAEELKIKAYGYNADDVTKLYGFKTSVREKLARVKVVLDFLLGTQPKFLGKKITIQ